MSGTMDKGGLARDACSSPQHYSHERLWCVYFWAFHSNHSSTTAGPFCPTRRRRHRQRPPNEVHPTTTRSTLARQTSTTSPCSSFSSLHGNCSAPRREGRRHQYRPPRTVRRHPWPLPCIFDKITWSTAYGAQTIAWAAVDVPAPRAYVVGSKEVLPPPGRDPPKGSRHNRSSVARCWRSGSRGLLRYSPF